MGKRIAKKKSKVITTRTKTVRVELTDSDVVRAVEQYIRNNVVDEPIDDSRCTMVKFRDAFGEEVDVTATAIFEETEQ